VDKLCETNETIKGIDDDGTNYSTTFLDQKLPAAISGSSISSSCVKGETAPSVKFLMIFYLFDLLQQQYPRESECSTE
jgi:hypothetical protein